MKGCLKTALDRENERHNKAIENIARKRIAVFTKWFASKFPKRTLRVEFYAMGLNYATIDGRHMDTNSGEFPAVYFRPPYGYQRSIPSLMPLAELFTDMDEITEEGHVGAPDGFTIFSQEETQ